MWRKLAGYSLISLLSFCFFTITFQTVASAQMAIVTPPSASDKIVPTPTLFFLPTPEPTNFLFQKSSPAIVPTPSLPATQNSQLALQSSQPPAIQPSPIATATPTPTPTTLPTPTSTPIPTVVPTAIPTATPMPTAVPAVTTTDIPTLFHTYSDTYHVDEGELKKIAQCESGFNPNSNNSGLYLGMFQFAAQSWMSVRARMGLDGNPDLRTNAEEAIKTAAYMLANGGQNAWPNCK